MRRHLAVTWLVVLAVAAAWARRGPGMSPEDQQEVLTYPLSLPLCDELITAMGELNTYVLAAPPIPAWVVPTPGQSPSDREKASEADPGATAIAK